MKLRELIKGCDQINSVTLGEFRATTSEFRTLGPKTDLDLLLDIDISGVAYDSRKVNEGYLFVAIKGERDDGHDFIRDAVKKGAVAVVHEHDIVEFGMQKAELNSEIPNPQSAITFIYVKNSRKALACIADNFYEKPSASLILIGVTGTNGKTTTTYILKSILEAWGKKVGLIGTIQYLIHEKVYPALHTTPESLEFHALLKDMLLSGCTHVVSEVSSHALAQFRVDRAFFDTAVFTNLTRDHLDFHKNMEDYFKAKERLFLEILDSNGTAIINLDDPYGKRLASSLHQSQHLLTYGLEGGADIIAGDINSSFGGLEFKISFRGRSYDVSSHLIGLPNVYNIISAVGVSISMGVPWNVILEGLIETDNVTGRFEKIDIGQDFLCIIDYAHTDDALERLIYTARELANQQSALWPHDNHPIPPLVKVGKGRFAPRIITVFGCGGDRDHGKRPRMGAVATRLSDFVIITSDNPRSEEPTDIIKEIEGGVVTKNYVIEPDRKEAIKKAVNMADFGDIVLIAGKGHEDYQEIKGVRYQFNDRDILEEILRSKLKVQNIK
jgi:UDP-N-acetylmuramoyl-L-alanyl-D-glutamate--2,6-diaminopimelate ligase